LSIQALDKLDSSLANCLVSGKEYTHQGQIEIIIVKSVNIAGIYANDLIFDTIKYIEITVSHIQNTTTK